MSKLLDSTRLQHVRHAVERLLKRFADSTLQDMLTDEDLQDIALRQFTIIGEAAAHVSPATRQRYPQLDWHRVTALRNFVVHEYFRVDYTIVWDTIVNILPGVAQELPLVLQQVLADEKARQSG